jgi:hypothetical protein
MECRLKYDHVPKGIAQENNRTAAAHFQVCLYRINKLSLKFLFIHERRELSP